MRRIVALGIVVVAGCSGSSADSDNTTTPTTAAAVSQGSDAPDETATTSAPATSQATTTTVALAELAMRYSGPGPFPVGVHTTALPKGNAVEIWYPAARAGGEEAYDVRDFVPPAIAALLTGDVPSTYTYAAGRDADVAAGQFPVVLFSHGFSGMRLQSTFLTAHLASWGMVVASADHPSRDLFNVIGNTASGDRADAVDDVLRTLDYLTQQNGDPTSAFVDHLDLTSVAAVGHSAGGGTVLGAAADERIDGYVSLASGTLGDATQPDKPSFYMAGANDAVVDADTQTYPAFTSAPPPTLYWQIDGVGHNGFDDFCTFGNGAGIIGVADASGLAAVVTPQQRTLGEDGCKPPNLPVEETFPIIRHAVTVWLLDLFGGEIDVPLDGTVSGVYSTPIRIEQR
jgi:dienelactone hydrolase